MADYEETNPFAVISAEINKSVEEALSETCEIACESMGEKLAENGHVGSGELIDSIDYAVTRNGDVVSARIKMNEYGKFIDSGTGASHGVQNGREGYWRYKDKDGQWHTTNGMDADPFIDISIEKSLISFSDELFKHIEKNR